MIVIGITGSIASGKSSVAKLIAKKKYPLFNADNVVTNLYNNSSFTNLLIKKFKLSNEKSVKNQIKLLIKKNKRILKILESVIHPLVRKEMKNFLKIKRKILVLEIPLLIESKLDKYFDKIIFVEAKKNLRLKRYLKHKNKKEIFETLNNRQLSSFIKKKSCHLTINNDHSLSILKKNVNKLMKNYE